MHPNIQKRGGTPSRGQRRNARTAKERRIAARRNKQKTPTAEQIEKGRLEDERRERASKQKHFHTEQEKHSQQQSFPTNWGYRKGRSAHEQQKPVSQNASRGNFRTVFVDLDDNAGRPTTARNISGKPKAATLSTLYRRGANQQLPCQPIDMRAFRSRWANKLVDSA